MTLDTEAFHAVALPGIPLIQPGDELVPIIIEALQRAQWTLQTGDVVVVSSKIVSKSEGRRVKLADVTPGRAAHDLAIETGKDPRIVELILQESTGVSRKRMGVLVTEHRLGFVSANAGIDQSNVGEAEAVLLLPHDPDEAARQIRAGLMADSQQDIAVVISDTHGRPFRVGNVGVAIGVAGMQAVADFRGEADLFGRELVATIQGYADLVASAAHLLCGEGAEGRPVVVLRGLAYPHGDGRASDLNRDPQKDLYR